MRGYSVIFKKGTTEVISVEFLGDCDYQFKPIDRGMICLRRGAPDTLVKVLADSESEAIETAKTCIDTFHDTLGPAFKKVNELK